MSDESDDRERNRQPNTAGLAQRLDGDDGSAARSTRPPTGTSAADDAADGETADDESTDEETVDEPGDADGLDDREDDLPSVPDDGWKAVDSPVDVTLLSVGFTTAGPVATGSAGKVLHRDPETGEWRVIIEAGVSVSRNSINDMDVTDDGERFWFVGDSGIIGAFDVAEGRKYDFSAPMEKTSTWESVGVTGEAGEELVVFANGSGELLPARMDEHGYPEWGTVHKPGRGSTMPGVDFDGEIAYAIDTTGKAYQRDFSDADLESEVAGKPGTGDGSDEPGTSDSDGDPGSDGDPDSSEADSGTSDDDEESADGGDSSTRNAADLADAASGDWTSPETSQSESSDDLEWREIGVRNAQVNFHDVTCEDGHLLVAGDDGIIYRYDRLADNWTPVKAGDDTIFAVDQFGDDRVAGGADGHVFAPEPMVGWQPRPTESVEDVHGIALGSDYAVAVGTSGTILEQHPSGDSDDRVGADEDSEDAAED